MTEYSEDYRAHAEATDDTDSWPTDSRGTVEVGITPEFGGGFDGPAPENYYAVTLTNCYVATLKVIADNSNQPFKRVVADGIVKLRPDDGTTIVDSFELEVEMHVDSAESKAEAILERTQDYCFILNSVDFPVNVDSEVVAADED
jgi:organic hydroperoxide reductase OsmC/OhrA